MKLSEHIFVTSKDQVTRIATKEQSFIFQAGYALLSKSNLIIYSSLFQSVIKNFVEILFSDYEEILVIKSDIKEIRSLVKQTLTSYKQLPLKFYSKIIEENENHIVSNGLLDPEHQYYLNMYTTIPKSEMTESIFEIWNLLYAHLNLNLKSYGSINVKGYLDESILAEFVIPTPNKGDEFVYCQNCGYISSKELARFKKNIPQNGEFEDLEEVFTPNAKSIDELTQFLEIKAFETAKVVFYSYLDESQNHQIALCVIRGDMEINEDEVKRILQVNDLNPATDDDIISIGAIPGFASPIGLDFDTITIIVDDLIPHCTNLVAGANKKNFHLKNTNFTRDYQADFIHPVALVKEGSKCLFCENPLKLITGYLVQQIRTYVAPNYLDPHGKNKESIILHDQFIFSRLFGLIAENQNDKFGLILPFLLSPFDIIIINIGKKEVSKLQSIRIYRKLSKSFRVLNDDRALRPGIMFADADLRGIPIRILISDKLAMENKIEIKERGKNEKVIIKEDELGKQLLLLIQSFKLS